MAAEVLRSEIDQTAFTNQHLGTYRRAIVVECDYRPLVLLIEMFDTYWHSICIKRESLSGTLVEDLWNTNVLFSDQLFEFVDSQKQAFWFGTRDSIEPFLRWPRLCKIG